jgi:ABC-type glycerol-3-phosphate transport system substrate-binding protein
MTPKPRMFMLMLALAVAAGFLVAGCGGDKKEEAAGAEGARIDCRADAFKGDPGLPAKFPIPAEFVVTESTMEGPTRVVVGYWESGLDEAYREWKDRIEEAGFTVTFDELEYNDSEVAYDGSGRTGIIQLRDRCNEDVVTYVRISCRPA